jgi:hypothetical protein
MKPPNKAAQSERLHKVSSLDACASELAIGFREQLASCHGGNFGLGEHKSLGNRSPSKSEALLSLSRIFSDLSVIHSPVALRCSHRVFPEAATDFRPQSREKIPNPGGDFVWHFEERQMASSRDDPHLRVRNARD